MEYHHILKDYFGFDKIYQSDIGKPYRESSDIFREAIKDINERKEKYFRVITHVDETLNPYGMKRDDRFKYFEFQFDLIKDRIEEVDNNFKYILDNIKGPTRIVITADHAEFIGEIKNGKRLAGHGAGMNRVEFDPNLFKIPLIIGDIYNEKQ